MQYFGTCYESFLEHHGVKGMKWGVRNRRSRFGRQKRYFDYEVTNRRGETVQKSTRISKGQARALRERGIINDKGDISSPAMREHAINYINSKKVARGVGAGLTLIHTPIVLLQAAQDVKDGASVGGKSGAAAAAFGSVVGVAGGAAINRGIGEGVGAIYRGVKNVPAKRKIRN